MSEGKPLSAIETRKTRVSDALWVLGPATTQAVSSITNDAPGRDRIVLRLLRDEGLVTYRVLSGNVFEWTLVRPYYNGTLSADVSALLWDEARPMSAIEVAKTLGIERSVAVSPLNEGVAKGKFVKGYESSKPVYWAKGRCVGPHCASSRSVLSSRVVQALRENGKMNSRQLAEALGDSTSNVCNACRSAESKGLVRECGRRLVWTGRAHVNIIVWEAVE